MTAAEKQKKKHATSMMERDEMEKQKKYEKNKQTIARH